VSRERLVEGPVLDGSAVTKLAARSPANLALLRNLRATGAWPARVSTVALADCLSGDPDVDEPVLRFLGTCLLVDAVPAALARRGAWLRTAAGRGSAADALTVALAEPGGSILAGDRASNVEALALFANGVFVERV